MQSTVGGYEFDSTIVICGGLIAGYISRSQWHQQRLWQRPQEYLRLTRDISQKLALQSLPGYVDLKCDAHTFGMHVTERELLPLNPVPSLPRCSLDPAQPLKMQGLPETVHERVQGGRAGGKAGHVKA